MLMWHCWSLETGLSSADSVLLVLDATPGLFEAHMEDNALEEGIHAPIKEQLLLLLLHTMGIKQVSRVQCMEAWEEGEGTRAEDGH